MNHTSNLPTVTRLRSLRTMRAWRHIICWTADRRGNIAMLSALSLSIAFGLAGGAIDFGRAYAARAQTQKALDAAVLAAGRVLQTTQNEVEAMAAAQQFYEQSKSPMLLGAAPTFSIENNKTLVRAAATGSINTLILGVLNLDSLSITVESHSEMAGSSNSGTNYEISMMLDVTGSMCDDGIGPCTSGTKIDALKAAATDLVNIAVWDSQSTYTARAAIVPFATRIRVGPNGGGGPMMKRLTNLDATWTGWYNTCTAGGGSGGSETGGNWYCTKYVSTHYSKWPIMPCVTDRTGPQEFTDADPGSDTWLNAHDGGRMPLAWDSADTAATSQLGKTKTDPADNWNYEPGGSCADEAESNQILPLTTDKNALSAQINGLTAYGATSGALGTAWAWYMISPNWDNVWTGTSKPAPYSDLTTMVNGRPKLKKVAVLMTDGEYNTYRGWKESDQAMVSANARTICQNMKNAGIEIYTVGFGLDQLAPAKRAEAEATLKACGSDIEHFYSALNVDQLKGAFRDIALKMAALRISK